MIYQNISLTLYHRVIINTILEQLWKLQHFIAEQTFLNILPTIMEWNKVDRKLRKSESLPYFRNALLKVGKPTAIPTYNIHNPSSLKLLARLRLVLRHLNEHKFKHNFQNCVNPLNTCSLEIEYLSHFFLHCRYFTNIRSTLCSELQSVDANIAKVFR